MEDAVGDSANGEASSSDIPMVSPSDDQMESVQEIGSSSSNGIVSNLVNGHDESKVPVVVADIDEPISQPPDVGEVDCLRMDSLNSVKDGICAPLSISSGAAAEAALVEGDDLDLDAEGESDPDAEGESDPDAVM